MTDRDFPLREARRRRGWTQAMAMRRFAAAAKALGCQAPGDESLRRMFAYWERGDREVTVPTYRDAFCAIYDAPPEALGFGCSPSSAAPVAETPELHLVSMDHETIALLREETQHLRVLDRRIGSATHAHLVDEHCKLLEEQMHRCVGSYRAELAVVLAQAATLAGWIALDRNELAAAWSHHET